MCLLGSGGKFEFLIESEIEFENRNREKITGIVPQESFTIVPLPPPPLEILPSLHKESRHPDCLLSRPMR